MFRLLLLVTLILLLTPAGCHSPGDTTSEGAGAAYGAVGHSHWSDNVSTKPATPPMKGARGLAFVRPEERGSDNRLQHVEFRIQEGDAFAPFLVAGNGADIAKTFLVTAILDYRQVEFKLDGIMGLVHEVVVPANTQIETPFEVEIGAGGAHDVQIIAFDDPYNLTLDPNYRSDLHGHVVGLRSVVIIGDDETPVRSFAPSKGEPIPSDVVFRPEISFASAPTSKNERIDASRRQLYVDRASAGEPYRFQVVVNNIIDESATYVVIPFLDFRQIALQGDNIIVTKLDPGYRGVLDLEVMLPEDPGIRQFQCIWIVDPYESVLRGETAYSFVFGSPRIAIEAR